MNDEMPTQSANGTPHMAYYVPEHQLSFVWSGRGPIEICHGGYGEPMIGTIDDVPIGNAVTLAHFQQVCDEWVTNEYEYEDERRVSMDPNREQTQEAERLRDAIVECITEYIEQHGKSPTRVQVADRLGINERTVRRHVAILQDEWRLAPGKRLST